MKVGPYFKNRLRFDIVIFISLLPLFVGNLRHSVHRTRIFWNALRQRRVQCTFWC